MKKKILFMVINMNVGGTEKALLSMIGEMNKEEYDITILMLEEYGGFLTEIPEWVKVKYLDNYIKIKDILNDPLHITAIKSLKNLSILKFIHIVYQYIIYKIKGEQSSLFKYVLSDYKDIEQEYDIAVAYAGPMDFISYFVINKIKTKRKIQWIHFDVTKIGFNVRFAKLWYPKFDKIFVVSEEGKNKLDNIIPYIKDKTEVFLNVLSRQNIRYMANKNIGFDDDFNGIRILTVGRLAWEKGQDITIPVLAKLKSQGYKVRWYCIGDGGLRERCEELISKYNLKEDYILLGTKTNPYPYMKECDIYVQPSVYEGYCITLAEARCLNIPIVSTDFIGAKEQLKHRENGMIVPRNEDDLYLNIKELIDNDELRDNIKINLQRENIDTSKEINKLFI